MKISQGLDPAFFSTFAGVLNNYELTHNYGKHCRDFIVHPITFSIEISENLIEKYHLHRLDSVRDFLDVFVKTHQDYIESGDNLILQISKLCFRLALYMTYVPQKDWVTLPRNYLLYSLRYASEYSKYIKKFRSIAHIVSISEVVLLSNQKLREELDSMKFEPFIEYERKYNYNDILPECYLIFFKEEVDDFRYSFIPVESNESALAAFREASKSLFSRYKVDEIEHPDNFEKATWISDSTTFDKASGRSIVNRTLMRDTIVKGDFDKEFSLKRQLSFKRTVIPVGPANFRDAWSGDLGTLYTIKYLSFLMRQIGNPIPSYAMGDFETSSRRKKRLNKNFYFIMLDQKKAGLTIPRNLISIIGDVLFEIYGDETFTYLSSYEDITVYDKNKPNRPLRGTGLGNANELMCLVQCVILEILHEVYPEIDGLFFNDDCQFGMLEKNFSVYPRLVQIYQDLGLIINLEKCIISQSNVFCEEYHSTEVYEVNYDKTILQLMPYADVFFQQSTWQAKRFMYQIDRSLVGTRLGISSNMVVFAKQFYKKEFFEVEDKIPYHLGGWLDLSETNFSSFADFIFSTSSYLTNNREQGQIPIIREWAWYLIKSSNLERSLLDSKSRILYKKDIDNPFERLPILDNDTPEGRIIFQLLGIKNPKERRETYHGLYNYRGMHNAKPYLKRHMAIFEDRRRRRIFKNFLKKRFTSPRKTLGRCFTDIAAVIHYLHEHEDVVDNISIPRSMVEYTLKIPLDETRNVIISRRKGYKPPPNVRYSSLSTTISSISTGTFWFQGTDPFVFSDIKLNTKYGRLISNIGIPNKFDMRTTIIIPSIYRLFCQNRRLLQYDFMIKHKAIPLKFSLSEFQIEEHDIENYDPVRTIYPELYDSWVSFVLRNKKYKDLIRRHFKSLEISSSDEFKVHMESLDSVLQQFIETKRPDRAETLVDNARYVSEFGINPIFENELSNMDILDVLAFEEENIYDRPEVPEEYKEGYVEEAFREDLIEPDLGDFEVPRDEANEDLFDDDLSYNEIRRLNRTDDFEF